MKTAGEKILLALNNSSIKEFLEQSPHLQGLEFLSGDPQNALKDILKSHPDLIVLEDTGSSDPDVFDLCYRIKNHPLMQHVQILMVNEREEEYLEAAAFNAGTNDYIIKPLLRPLALTGRIKSLLKSNGAPSPSLTKTNGKHTLRIDKDSFAVYLNDKIIDITRKEFDLLALLSSKPGKLFTRKEIFQNVWKKDVVSDRTIDVHIRRLRMKIGIGFIATQKGVGYRFSV